MSQGESQLFTLLYAFPAMPTIELFTWRVPHRLKAGVTYLTRYKMTREEAQTRHPGALCVESSRELREVPDGLAGHGAAAAIVAAGGSGHQQWK